MSVQRSATKAIATALNLRGTLSATGWKLPANLSKSEWVQAGVLLGAFETGVQWWIGDWWRYGDRYGERVDIVTDPDWQGVSHEICRNLGSIADKFDDVSRRRDTLSFNHHVEVAPLPAAEADKLLDWCEETIAETGKPRSIRDLRSAYVNLRNANRLSWIAAEAQQWPIGRYSVIYADPPWQYDHPISTTREIENQYPTMDIEAICNLPVSDLAADRAMLYLWVPPSFLHKGQRVIEAWGFDFLTSMVWDKQRDGMGYYVRQRHENLLVAHVGDGLVPPPSTLPSSIVSAPRGAHSEKPTEFYELIERMYPGLPKIELFSRKAREGWSTWGNQALAA